MLLKLVTKLVREQGAWKIDDVSLDMPGQATEPLRPERAVDDVVTWARQNGASSLNSWLQKTIRTTDL